MITAVTVDTRDSIRLCRTVSSGLVQAAVTALKRTAANVRSKYIAALRNVGNKDTGPLAPFDGFWYWRGAGNTAPGSRKPGGILTTTGLWKLRTYRSGSGGGVVEVDIAPRLQPVLERWQFGGGNRAQMLRDWVRSIPQNPSYNKWYHGTLVDKQGWPAWHALPPVPEQPERNVVGPITKAVAPLLPEWFDKALAKILAGKAKSWTRSAAAPSAARGPRKNAHWHHFKKSGYGKTYDTLKAQGYL